MTRAAALLALLWLSACQGEDAYLGSSHTGYQCGSRCKFEQGVPSDAGEWFFNPVATLGQAPELVYPLQGSVHPRDLHELTVQFRRGRSDFELFRLRLAAPEQGLAYDFFVPCLAVGDDGCRYLLRGSLWDDARADLQDKAVTLTVSGATGRDGVVLASKPIDLTISASQLENKGFYYWTTVPLFSGDDNSETGIFRLPFGADQAEPFIMPNTDTNQRQCGACHSVSRDGSTIAFTARNDDGNDDQRSGVLVASSTARPSAPPIIAPPDDAVYDSSMMALSSDGKRVLVAYDDSLVLRSADTLSAGEVLATLTPADLGGKSPYFPEFSRDDAAVVLTLSDQPDSAIAVQSGDIAVIDVGLSGPVFSEPRIVVAGDADEFHFYPTWSPDGDYIAFASAPRGVGEDGNPRKSYDQKQARLRLVRVEDGRIFELERATQAVGKWSTFPKFAPFSDGGLMYLTFNSKMSYGLVLDNDALPEQDRLAQLWMSAIDVRLLPEDPSSAPIWLPFQDATQSSHLGIWTDDVKCRDDLGSMGCPIGQECDLKTRTCRVQVK